MDSKYPVVKSKISEYKGNEILTLTTGTNERYPFSFGLQKAKRILAAIPDIERFVARGEEKARIKSEEKSLVAKTVNLK